ncbi:hypothetical protein OROHE_013458 [Orobanche hederae]
MNQNEICSCEEKKRSSDLVFSDEKEEPLQKKRLSDLSEKQLEKIYEVEEVFWDTHDPLFEGNRLRDEKEDKEMDGESWKMDYKIEYQKQQNTGAHQVHGTTTIAIYNGTEIVVAADSRETFKGDIKHDNAVKIHVISKKSNLICTGAGNVGKWKEMFKYVLEKVLEEENRTGNLISATYAKDQVISWCDSQPQETSKDQGKSKMPIAFSIILIGWPSGQAPEMHRIQVRNNRPNLRIVQLEVGGETEEPFRAGTGSGYSFAKIELMEFQLTFDLIKTMQLCYRAMFRAMVNDPLTGGPLRFVVVKQGHCGDESSISPLQAYVECFEYDSDQPEGILFLFQPIGAFLTHSSINELWSSEMVRPKHTVLQSRDFILHRLAFVNEKASNDSLNHIYFGGRVVPTLMLKEPIYGKSQCVLIGHKDHHLVLMAEQLCFLTRRDKELLEKLRVSSEGATMKINI